MLDSLPATPKLEVIDDPCLRQFGVHMDVLRLDRIHPLINGNKWFKLKLNLQQAQQEGHSRLLSFGGAYSNHLRALSAAARLAGMESIGLVRGEIPEPLNPVLNFASQQGMELFALTREEYRNKHRSDFIAGLAERFGRFYLIPEGGSNLPGVLGCSRIVQYLELALRDSERRTVVAVACGTGATLAGLIRGAGECRLSAIDFVGVAVLKGAEFLNREVGQWLDSRHRAIQWTVATDWHCGGYAKTTPGLSGFIDSFTCRTGIPLEPVYTGKLVYGLYGMIKNGMIEEGSRVIWLHTGGIY